MESGEATPVTVHRPPVTPRMGFGGDQREGWRDTGYGTAISNPEYVLPEARASCMCGMLYVTTRIITINSVNQVRRLESSLAKWKLHEKNELSEVSEPSTLLEQADHDGRTTITERCTPTGNIISLN